MANVVDFPFQLFLFSLAGLAFSSWLGMLFRKWSHLSEHDAVDGFDVVRGATLTLLALLIGFTFSMAVSRYDQRKNYEEAEANAVGTEFLRASLLPAANQEKVRALLLSYTDQRIQFYTVRDPQRLRQIDARTADLQAALWAEVSALASAKQTPVAALVAAGMNDVLNSQGYTQAAWWNRIPIAAWMLMGAMGVCSAMLVGYCANRKSGKVGVIWVLPLVVSIAFFLIADIDSPRRGVIRVVPQNLRSLLQTLQPQ